MRQVQQVKGLGVFAAELVVVHGANHPDVLPYRNADSPRRSPSEIGRPPDLRDLS
ncbi:hypothetical protein ABZX90_22230 [Streptomyces sp. NPDC002935]|uniref:hypothetical protein n=1 Tax=unclassified Streptomyces TaxID=2593676 RepID=UPI00331878AD